MKERSNSSNNNDTNTTAKAHQYLITFQQKTHVLNNIPSPSSFNININPTNTIPITITSLLQKTLTQKLNFPSHIVLQVKLQEITTHVTYVIASFKHSQILGGKGGFGTLLKAQSKGAPNKVTLNFGACRDLNGRRLRFVNEELKMRALMSQDGPKYNSSGWYLDSVPNWSGISHKAKRRDEMKRKRETEEVKVRKEEEDALKESKKNENERKVMQYVNYDEGEMMNTVIGTSEDMEQCILQGLLKKRKLKQREDAKSATIENEDETVDMKQEVKDDVCTVPWLGILAGEIQQINPSKRNSNIHLRSTSDFATGCILLSPHDAQNNNNLIYYYEVTLQSSGILQIGWTSPNFSPNTPNDGIGDDSVSYGYDGSRQLIFHDNTELPYGGNNTTTPTWKEGDVIGSYYNPIQQKIGYYRNGIHLGVAFEKVNVKELFPAFSLNFGEEIQLPLEDFLFCPKDCISILSLLDGSYFLELEKEKERKAVIDENTTTTTVISTDTVTTATNIEDTKIPPPTPKEETNIIINLNEYSSVAELLQFSSIGLDILKYNLQCLGCKCGGTLEERAKRLFSLKGLDRNEYPSKVLTKR